MTENNKNLITDYITGKKVKATPEEKEAVQPFTRQLVEDYGYDKAQIQTHPQWRVKARPSDTKKEYPIDIAVFSKSSKKENELYIIVECKKRTRKDGISQLQDYLRLSPARLGVWFNGQERSFIKKTEKEGKVYFEEIPNIPQKGQRIEDIGKFKRKDLKKPHNLKTVFRAIRNTLAGSAVGITRDEELAEQLINIIFCKIYDERFTKQDDQITFRAGVDESDEKVAERIKELFEKVKTKYVEVLDFSDAILLDNRSIVYVVGELQNYCLTEAERDAIADAFETFIGAALKGAQGQFFTPRNVIKLMVEIANPKNDEIIIDPAAGSGGFLIESLRHIWNKLDSQAKEYGWSDLALNEEKNAVAIHNIRGLEKDEFLSKVAKAYMAIIGDGKGGIFCEDSLETPDSWKSKTRQNIELGKFDVVLTNPPFGKDIKITGEDKLKQFELAYTWKKTDKGLVKTNKLSNKPRPDILFIERCLQLLRKGGRLGIILPETYFHATKSAYIRQFIQRHNIYWIVDLPHNTFRPHNNAKTLILFIQKDTPQQEKINMAVAEEMGHDHTGKEIYRWDYKTNRIDKNNLWDDIPLILEEIKENKNKKYTFSLPEANAKKTGVYVPRFYWTEKEKEVVKLAKEEKMDLISVRELLNKKILKAFDGHGSPPAEYKGRGDIPYIRVKDIVNWEIYKDPTSAIPEEIYLNIKGENKDLQEKDVLYVRRGSYRIGSVAMVSAYDKKVLLTREILVLRVENENNSYTLNPYYLLYLLSHRFIAMQAFNKILIETTLPNIGNRWKDLKLPIHKDKSIRKRITEKVKEIIDYKWNALKGIKKLEEELGKITT